jgi:FKBP-type peptidyl-prolyl cis-trans isomerase FkpA
MKVNKLFSFGSLAIAAGLIFSACGNADYKVTPSGVKYNVFGKGTGQKIMPGQWIKLHYKASIGDSVMIETYGRIPAYGQYDSSMKNTHDFIDLLGELRIGDSVVFLRSIDTLQKLGFLQYNEIFKKGQFIKGSVTILAVFPSEQAVMDDQSKETVLEKEREVVAMEKFLKEQNIQGYEKTKSGVFIKLERKGDGPKADSGMTISVNYTGALKNGKKFDSNVDTAFGHVGPFDFVAGTGGVIAGWDEAITYFNKGGKGKVYIPAMLGYGSNAQGDRIPAFSDLVFEIEVLDVKPTDKSGQNMQAPVGH